VPPHVWKKACEKGFISNKSGCVPKCFLAGLVKVWEIHLGHRQSDWGKLDESEGVPREFKVGLIRQNLLSLRERERERGRELQLLTRHINKQKLLPKISRPPIHNNNSYSFSDFTDVLVKVRKIISVDKLPAKSSWYRKLVNLAVSSISDRIIMITIREKMCLRRV